MVSVRGYIAGQEQHHRPMNYGDELLALLQKYGIDYDPRFVFD